MVRVEKLLSMKVAKTDIPVQSWSFLRIIRDENGDSRFG